MYICPNCKHSSETPVAFCSMCGSRMEEQTVQQATPAAPVYEAPAAPVYVAPAAPVAPTYTAPATACEAPATKPHKAKVIVGMALGIAGLVLAAMGLLETLIFAFMEGELAFGYSIGFGIFSTPLAIVGMSMSRKNIEEGDDSAMSSVGKNLGLVGMILSFVMCFVGFVALLASL